MTWFSSKNFNLKAYHVVDYGLVNPIISRLYSVTLFSRQITLRFGPATSFYLLATPENLRSLNLEHITSYI